MENSLTKHMFRHGSQKYFRGNAHKVVLGTVRQKKDPIGPKSYIDIELDVRRKFLKGHVKSAGPFEINWSKESKHEIDNLGIKYLTAEGSASLTHEHAKSADLVLIHFYVNERDVKNILNNEAHVARAAMKDEGKDARIITDVWAVVSAEIGDSFSTGAKISADVEAGAVSLAVSGGASSSGTNKVILSEGTTFAYAMMKVKKWKKDVIDDMEVDYKGMS